MCAGPRMQSCPEGGDLVGVVLSCGCSLGGGSLGIVNNAMFETSCFEFICSFGLILGRGEASAITHYIQCFFFPQTP